MTLITLGSICLNSLASYVLVAKFHISKPQMKILLSMYIGDAIAPALSYPLVIYANFRHIWDLGVNACDYYSFITSTGGISSIYHLVLLSAERFLAIVYPYQYNHIMSTRKINVALVASWVFPVITSSLPLFGWSSYKIEGIGTACAVDLFPSTWSDRSFNIYLICIAFVFPIITILFFNFSFLGVVFKLVKCPCNKHHANRKNGQHSSLCQASKDRGLAKQMCVLVTLLIFCFFVSWCPYAVVTVIGISGKLPHDSPKAVSIPSFFAKAYSLYDPIVYFFLDKRFRKAVISLLWIQDTVNRENGKDLHAPLQRENTDNVEQNIL